jgi:tyrosinase
MASIGELQRQVDDVLDASDRTVPVGAAAATLTEQSEARPFSGFRLTDVHRATTLASQWMRTAEETRGENGSGADMAAAVGAVLDAAHDTVQKMVSDPREDPELARYAVKLFLTHYRHGLPLRIKGLEARAPWLILPSKGLTGDTTEANPEERLLWLREDPKLNEHHEHWHVVYPIAGVPAPGTERKGVTKDRQGELFLYMHRQMLARYDTERLAVGLQPVEAWGYHDADPWGYDPGRYLQPRFRPRAPGLKWVPTLEGNPKAPSPHDVTVQVQDMVDRGERLFAAARSGYFELPDKTRVPVDANLLGLTQEADIGSVEAGVLPWDPKRSTEDAWFHEWYNAFIVGHYGNFHNVGHDMFAWLSDENVGVMESIPTAMRDHVFYRWHKLIDDLYFAWQETQASHDFISDAPPVTIRKGLPDRPVVANRSPDIILCLKRDLIAWDRWEEFGEYAFGGEENWEREFEVGHFEHAHMPTGFTTTDELLTGMHRRVITIETGAEKAKEPEEPHEIEYLDQEEFFYFFRLENTSDRERNVTVRVFLAAIDPPELAEDRRMWIEMDKFKHLLRAHERAVVFRPADLSSVIRKPAVKPPTAEQPPIPARTDPMQHEAEILGNYCDCGWPYNLLLPRGTREGMPFRLLVMLTDWGVDNVPQEGDCGSMSYCGARDKYPDTRPMGYPFDAPFRDKSIAETISEAHNMATRDILIRWS